MIHHPSSNSYHQYSFRCPECKKGGFRSISAVKDHFIARVHVANCGICNVNFEDVLSFIEHYQSHKEQNALSPNSATESATKMPAKIKHKATAQLVISSRRTLEKKAKKKKSWAEVQQLKPLDAQVPKQETQATTSIKTTGFIHSLHQKFIVQTLQAKCHSWARLQTEGYYLGLSPAERMQRSSKSSIPYEHYLTVPQFTSPNDKRLAVVIDCEMVEDANGYRMLAYLSAIDFFTGEVLINNFVKPTEKVENWKTEFSGVTPALMSCACAAGEAIRGWQAARQRVWEFTDADTVLVGHSLNCDLDVLGLIHLNVVDSAILTSETALPPASPTEKLRRMWSLKTLAKDFMKRDIQSGRSGHSALEDAFATRDVVQWCLDNPGLLQAWAKKNKFQHPKRGPAKKGKKASTARQPQAKYNDAEYYQDLETMHWSDIAEDCGWPHPDTGYDPWSD